MARQFTDDNILLDELKKHNQDAYKYFYQTSRVRLFVLALSILHDEDAAKDLLQDFYTDFWEERLYAGISYSLRAYVYMAIKNRALLHKKDLQSYARVLENVAGNFAAETPRYFENEELKNIIEAAIEKLPPMAGKVFRMHYIENLTHKEITEKLGIRMATVANHIHRALTELRVELKKKLYND